MEDDLEMPEVCYRCGRQLEVGEIQTAGGCQFCAGWDEED